MYFCAASVASVYSVLLTIKFIPSREEFLGSFLRFTQSSDSRKFALFAAYVPDLKQLSSVPFVKPLCPLWLVFGCGSAKLCVPTAKGTPDTCKKLLVNRSLAKRLSPKTWR